MLTISAETQAFICREPINMRSGFDSLSGMIKSQLGENPLSGKLFVFLSRRRDRVKILVWELDGYALYYKRLEYGTFSWMQDLDLTRSCEIPAADLALLLSSVNYRKNRHAFRSTHQKKQALHLV